jgi:hypothetical protein
LDTNTITIAVQSYNFQKRLIYFLSSILQLENVEDILVDVAVLDSKDNLDFPKTREVLEFFKTNGLNIKITEGEINRFHARGYIRNEQIKTCSTEWILFADSDLVYHPRFFTELLKRVDVNYKYMYVCGRCTSNEEKTEELLASLDRPKVIDDVFDLIKNNVGLSKIGKIGYGAGFFQLINARRGVHGNFYVEEKRISKRNSFNTDIKFRKRIKAIAEEKGDEGITTISPKHDNWLMLHQIHLQHCRNCHDKQK